MRILYVAHKYEYGVRARGHSFEHNNFYESLVADGHDVDYFDLTEHLAAGRDTLNGRLVERAATTRPDLVFFFMFEDELDPAAVRSVTQAGHSVTFNWFGDDHWRFESFSKQWAPCFTYVSTTASSALAKYAAAGITNVLKTQWAAADSLYKPAGLPLTHDVSFVGQVYGDRPQIIRFLRKQGVPVEAYGLGWRTRPGHRAVARVPGLRRVAGPYLERVRCSTRVEQDGMIRLFEQSRINLNLTEASQGSEAQIKGRTFEVPACRGFLLSGPAQDLEEYFDIGREIAVYDDAQELPALCRYYLAHESQRAAMADAAYRRTVAEHTYRERFRRLFAQMDLR